MCALIWNLKNIYKKIGEDHLSEANVFHGL